jgi:hypothetical protein
VGQKNDQKPQTTSINGSPLSKVVIMLGSIEVNQCTGSLRRVFGSRIQTMDGQALANTLRWAKSLSFVMMIALCFAV